MSIEVKLLSDQEMGEVLTRAYTEGWELMFPPIYSGEGDRSNLTCPVIVEKTFLCIFKRM